MRFPVRGTYRFFTWLHDHGGWVFYRRPVLYLTAAITVGGIAAFIALLRQGRDPLAPLGSSYIAGIAVLVLAYYGAIFVHECAHAVTAKHFGRTVDEAGFMLYYLVPAFYVDVTDTWLEPWSRRIAIFWAGPYSGFVLAGLTSIVVFLLPAHWLVAAVLLKFALAAYVNNAFNLMPLLLLDGYWILEEWMETPGLRQRALDFVRGPMWHQLLDRRRFNRREAFYAVFGALCAVYSFISIYIAFLYWGRRLKPIVRPFWQTPGLLPKVLVGLLVGAVAIPLGIRFGGVARGYLRTARNAPTAARQALRTIRTRDRLRLLEGMSFLTSVPVASLVRLAHAAQVREIAAGAVVVRQGERGDEFFIVAEGNAEVTIRESADDRIAARLTSGDFFGEGALLGTGVRGATVRALTPLKVLVLGQRAFWAELAGPVGWQTRVRSALEERRRLQTLPLFAETSERQLDLLAVRLQVRPYQAGEVLVREGEPGDAFYIVREGSLEVEVGEGSSRRQVNTLKPGEFFGEIALLKDIPRTATVRAATAGSVWRLERQDFHDLLGRYLDLEGELAGVAASRAGGHSMRGTA
jgi:putative peptide zinc metalloprotease protein